MYTDVTSILHVRGLALVCIILFLNCVFYGNALFSGQCPYRFRFHAKNAFTLRTNSTPPCPSSWNVPALHKKSPVDRSLLWHGSNRNEAEHFKNCYLNSPALAKENDCRTIAFPCTSHSVYHCPEQQAARLLDTVLSNLAATLIK